MKLNGIINGAIKSYVGAIGLYLDYGTVTGTTITFKHKFVSAPTVLLTPIAGTTASVVTKDVDDDGFYITATIASDADSVDWIAIGTGIEVTVTE